MAKNQLRNSRYCIFVIVFSQITVLLPMGMNLTALNPSAPSISRFINETFIVRYGTPATSEQIQLIIALAQSMLTIGGLVDAVVLQYFIANLSRRSNLVLSHVIAIVSAILMSPLAYFGKSYEALIIGRFLNGFSRGLAFTITPLIVAETTTRRQVALFQSPTFWLIQLGSAMGNALAHPDVLGGVTTWPYLLALPGLFSLAYVLLVPWLPQTPTYVILQEQKYKEGSKNTNEQETASSLKLLSKLRSGSEEELMKEYDDIIQDISANSHIARASVREIFHSEYYRRQLFGVVVVTLSLQATGLQAVLQYTNTMFSAAGIGEEKSTFYAIGICILMVVTGIACTPIMRKWGSKRILLVGLCLVASSLGLLTISTITSRTAPSMSYVSIASLFLCVIGASAGPGLVGSALSSEITTEVTRPTAFWIAGVCFWILATLIIFLTPFGLAAIGGYTYLFFFAAVLLCIIYTKLKIPNTHNRTSAEIQNMLERKSNNEPIAEDPSFLTALL